MSYGKFSIQSSILKKVLTQLNTTIKKNKTNEFYEKMVFRTIPLEDGSSQLVLIGSSNETEIQIPLEVKWDKPFLQDFCLNFAAFKKAIDAIMTDSEIIFELKGENKLLMKVGRSKINLETLGTDAYPFFKMDNTHLNSSTNNLEKPSLSSDCDWSEFQKKYYNQINFNETDGIVILDISEFNHAITQVSHMMGVNDLRYYLNAMALFIKTDNSISLYGTDGHRMAGQTISSNNIKNSGTINNIDFQYILPRNTVIELPKLNKGYDKDDKVMLIFYKGVTQFVYPNGLLLSSKIITGKYPDPNRVLRERSQFYKEDTVSITFNKIDLINELNMALTMIPNGESVSQNSFGISFNQKEMILELTKATGKVFESSIDVELSSNGPDDLIQNNIINGNHLTFNIYYLLDALNIIDSEKVTILIDHEWGILSRSIALFDFDESNALQNVLMPTRY